MFSKINAAILLLLLLITLASSSCLKRDLPDLPLYDQNEITLVNTEYRFSGSGTMNGQPIVAYQKLDVAQQVNKETGTINVQITVPAASGQFTTEERNKVVQTHLWFYYNVSTAATMKAIDGTPAPGDPADATKPLKYEVTAANGAKKVWTVNVTSFTK